jgi:type III secretory pathway component EscU
MTPDLLTIAEVAKLLKMSRKAVLRRFKNMPGVIDLGSPETKTKRGY